MFSSALSRQFDEQHRFDLTGQDEINFLLKRAGKTIGDNDAMPNLESLRQARKSPYLQTSTHRNREAKKADSRKRGAQKRAEFSTLSPEEQAEIRERKREQQRCWRERNAERLAASHRERRARKKLQTS
ncbi:hypothetical protein VNI00_018904 [Paramarasmius palmivorus]|uniref:Uncharacterized protein n=1 Tax=Paramarasmius palmivorus TaxID=297713 RepID=A0AAW0ASH4_9AGAR